MADWTVQSVIFRLKTARTQPCRTPRHFLRKMSELPKLLIEVKILPVTFCLHCPILVAVLFLKIKRYICFALHLVRALHIESVFAVLQENVEVFKNEG